MAPGKDCGCPHILCGSLPKRKWLVFQPARFWVAPTERARWPDHARGERAPHSSKRRPATNSSGVQHLMSQLLDPLPQVSGKSGCMKGALVRGSRHASCARVKFSKTLLCQASFSHQHKWQRKMQEFLREERTGRLASTALNGPAVVRSGVTTLSVRTYVHVGVTRLHVLANYNRTRLKTPFNR